MMVKLTMMLLILLLGGLLIIKGPDGEPLLEIEDFLDDAEETFQDLVPDESPFDTGSSSVTRVYKWKDDNGVWQFSNMPVERQDAELLEFDGQINIIRSIDVSTSSQGSTEVQGSIEAIPGVMTVSPEQAADMIKTVTNLQETVDQRKADLDALVGP